MFLPMFSQTVLRGALRPEHREAAVQLYRRPAVSVLDSLSHLWN